MTKTFKARSRRLSAALLMSSAIALVMFGQPAEAGQRHEREFEAFVASRYNYCDAKMVGALYGQDVVGGKVIIGQKILNGIGENVPVVLAESRNDGNFCDWRDTGFTYQDALVLSNVWGFRDLNRAKLKAADLFTNGNAAQVHRALGD
jgi:hypothetical protein